MPKGKKDPITSDSPGRQKKAPYVWLRLDEAKLRNLGGAADYCRAYGLNGELWPRIVLSVSYDYRDDRNVRICVSRKEGPSVWWEPSALPVQLASELADMLLEAKIKRKAGT